ncbi:MAG: transcriptional regulator GcvA [Hyphomicrobiales bacterium]|nr:transcriptional regulator GcvA [Hyphomicrobiales bacterium]
MSKPVTALPSLNALRAFEAAARHQSFKAAAEELHVTASAIGHLVADLEAYFGCALFVRRHRRVDLTAAGQDLLPGLRAAFDQLRNTVRSFHRDRHERPLVVSVDPTYGARCLIPRLERFRSRHPEITVRIDPTPVLADPREGDVDVCIRYGRGDYPGLVVETLVAHERIVAVCSPDLLSGEHPLRTLEDFRFHTLIDRTPNQYYEERASWPRWFKAAGRDEVLCKNHFEVPWEDYAIISAIQGQGVTLASNILVAEDLTAGRLVEPFDIHYTLDRGYHLVTAPTDAPDPRIDAFKTWMFDVQAELSRSCESA